MGPTQDLSYLLHHLSMVLGKLSEDLLKEQLGIGLSQYRILAVLDWNPKMQQSTIASSLGQSEASISRQMKILEARGLVEVEKDPLNKRKHIAKPTPKGMQITESATSLIKRNLASDHGRISEEQAAEMISGLLKLHKIVCMPGKSGSCSHPLGV